jgi:hypothetical protein
MVSLAMETELRLPNWPRWFTHPRCAGARSGPDGRPVAVSAVRASAGDGAGHGVCLHGAFRIVLRRTRNPLLPALSRARRNAPLRIANGRLTTTNLLWPEQKQAREIRMQMVLLTGYVLAVSALALFMRWVVYGL